MFTQSAFIIASVIGMFVSAGDSPDPRPACCEEGATCCSLKLPCCTDAAKSEEPAVASMADTGREFAVPNCCAMDLDCCRSQLPCCDAALADAIGSADRSEVSGAQHGETAKPNCCHKRAHCCVTKQPCCRLAAVDVAA